VEKGRRGKAGVGRKGQDHEKGVHCESLTWVERQASRMFILF
jgi:hypothetical protein